LLPHKKRKNLLDISGGSVVAFDVGLGVNIMDNGFILEIYGNVNAINTMNEKKDKVEKSIVLGMGHFTYNNIEGTFLGHANVKVDGSPVICADGDMDLSVTKNSFGFSVGTRDNPLKLDVLCRNKPILFGWFALSDENLDMGAYIDIDEKLETGWIGIKCAEIKPWMQFKFYSGFTTIIDWNPFRVAEAELWLDLYAGVGVKYNFCVNSGNLTIAEVGLGGALKYVAEPESLISGRLYGKVTVLTVGFDLEFSTTVKL
jgi:hypothetical protein